MEGTLRAASRIYFEALCILDVETVSAASTVAVVKIARFCKDTGLTPYIVRFIKGNHEECVFLTKQKMVAATGYYCVTSNVSLRRFGPAEVLVGNCVKRIMAKSDSKFIEKFAQMLEPASTYLRLVSNTALMVFTRVGSSSTLTIHRIESTKEEVNSGQLVQGSTYKWSSQPPMAQLALCSAAVSPPNILCTLWDSEDVIINYVIAKSAEGDTEEGECPIGSISHTGFFLKGIGSISYHKPVQKQIQESPQTPDSSSDLHLTAKKIVADSTTSDVERDTRSLTLNSRESFEDDLNNDWQSRDSTGEKEGQPSTPCSSPMLLIQAMSILDYQDDVEVSPFVPSSPTKRARDTRQTPQFTSQVERFLAYKRIRINQAGTSLRKYSLF